MPTSDPRLPITGKVFTEAQPREDTFEISAAEWDAMIPGQRADFLDDLAAEHMTNAGGYGWSLDDPEREADVEHAKPTGRRFTMAYPDIDQWGVFTLKDMGKGANPRYIVACGAPCTEEIPWTGSAEDIVERLAAHRWTHS